MYKTISKTAAMACFENSQKYKISNILLNSVEPLNFILPLSLDHITL